MASLLSDGARAWLGLGRTLTLTLTLTTDPDTGPDPNQVGSGAHMSALERTHNGPFHVCVDGAPPLSEARKVRPVVHSAC